MGDGREGKGKCGARSIPNWQAAVGGARFQRTVARGAARATHELMFTGLRGRYPLENVTAFPSLRRQNFGELFGQDL